MYLTLQGHLLIRYFLKFVTMLYDQLIYFMAREI